MRDPIEAIFGALERNSGIVIVWYPDLGLRQWLVTEVETLSSAAQPIRTSSVEDAIQNPDRTVLLIPDSETEAVLDLDGSRDRLLHRRHPVVLFLVRDGAGAKTLAERAPSLWSWVGGSDPDPEKLAEIDADEERQRFLECTGMPPEPWLADWRLEQIPRTGENYAIAYRAMLLERS